MKRRLFRLNRRTVVPFVVLVVLAVVIVAVTKHGQTNAAPSKSATASSASQFSFPSTLGWHQGPTNKTSMALFSNDESCFTSIEHKPGIVNVAAQLQKQQDDLATGGNTMTQGVVLTAVIQTGTGQQQYELHQYSLSSGGDGEQLMGGLELGYLQLSHGYLMIQGHCNTAAQLPTTIPALQAYKFNVTS